MSFISKFKDATIGVSGYPRLVRDPAGGFGYLSLLLLIVLTIAGVITTVQVKAATSSMVGSLARGPDFLLKDGQFTFDGPMPFRIEDSRSVLIIDTTGKSSTEQLRQAGYGSILITRTAIHSVGPFGQIRSSDFAQYPVTIGKQDVLLLLENAHAFVPMGYLFMYAGQLAFKAIDAAVLALIAVTYGTLARIAVPFKLGFKAALYAMTMPILIQWILPGFTTLTPLGFSLWWGLAILYLIMGVRAHHRKQEAPVADAEEDS